MPVRDGMQLHARVPRSCAYPSHHITITLHTDITSDYTMHITSYHTCTFTFMHESPYQELRYPKRSSSVNSGVASSARDGGFGACNQRAGREWAREWEWEWVVEGEVWWVVGGGEWWWWWWVGCVRVCACVRACVRACERARARVCV